MLSTTQIRARSAAIQTIARWVPSTLSTRTRNDDSHSHLASCRRHLSSVRSASTVNPRNDLRSSSYSLDQDQSSSSSSSSSSINKTRSSTEPKSASGKRLSRSQKQMLENGQLLAQAIRSGSSSSSNLTSSSSSRSTSTPAPPTSSSTSERPDFLTLLTTSSTSPSPPQPSISPDLRVLLTCRPSRPPRPHHKTYEWIYNGHFEKLNRAFLKEQLVSMYNELRDSEIAVLSGMSDDLVGGKPREGLPVLRRDVKKKEVIERILREWGWPTMKEVRKEKKMREENKKVVAKPIALSPAEHYFLRREPNFIRDLAARNMLQLTLSRSSNPDVALSTFTSNSDSTSTSTPTLPPSIVLIIKGRGFDVEQFEAGVRRRFEKLNAQMFGQEVVGGQEGVRLDHLYETISVMSGAFVETTQGGNIKISHFDPSDRDRAFDLLRAARGYLTTAEPTSRAEIISLLPESIDQPHAMYPYLPPTAYVPSALSASSVVAKTEIGSDWYLAGQSWFRIRQVGGWFDRSRERKNVGNEGIVTISGKVAAETLDEFKRADQPDWVKLVTSVEYGQLIFSSGNTQNTTWTAPISGGKTFEQLNLALRENSLSTVFLPGSISPLHEIQALGRPPRESIRLRYEEEIPKLDNDWKPFVEIECDVHDGTQEPGVPGEIGLRGATGREQVQYCLRPASDTDARIRRRFTKALELDEVPSAIRQYAKALSTNVAGGSPAKPPSTIDFDGKVFHLRHAARINSYQDSDEPDVRDATAPLFEHSTDLLTNIRGSHIEEKVFNADLAILQYSR